MWAVAHRRGIMPALDGACHMPPLRFGGNEEAGGRIWSMLFATFSGSALTRPRRLSPKAPSLGLAPPLVTFRSISSSFRACLGVLPWAFLHSLAMHCR